MDIEHRLDLLGVQRAMRGFHALGLAPAEPQPPGRIEIADIAHAVDDAGAAIGQRLADLGEPGRRVAVEVAVGRGRSGHGDFADHARRHFARAGPVFDGGIVDGDDAHFIRRTA